MTTSATPPPRATSTGAAPPGPEAVRPNAARPDLATALAVTVTLAAWATAFVAIRSVGRSFEPGALALGRLLIASLALGLLLLARRMWVRPSARDLRLLALCGLSWFAIYNVALNAAEQRLDAGTAAMLVSVGPILIALLAGVLLTEGFPRPLLIGAGVAFAGALLIGAATVRAPGADPAGALLCLLAALTWALGVIAQKPVLRRMPALQVTWLACSAGALACLPFAGHLLAGARGATPGALAGLIYLGVVPTALGFSTWAYALSRTDASRLGITTYLVPPLTILIAWPVLGEVPPPLALAGGLLALTGVALSRRRPRPAPRRAAAGSPA